MKVLIAEDDTLSRWYLKNVLINWGHEVTACENGTQAWDNYRRGDYHIVISDWAMPEMDGIELCRRVRKSPLSRDCYFILLSSRVGKPEFVQDQEAGVNVYLSEPVDANQLKSHIKIAELVLGLREESEDMPQLLPMCAWCRKARLADDLWFDMHEFVPESSFTYSICPECSRQLKGARAMSAAE